MFNRKHEPINQDLFILVYKAFNTASALSGGPRPSRIDMSLATLSIYWELAVATKRGIGRL